MTNFIKLMSRIRVVLVRPQVAGNIGAVARLMENFQAGGLYLVDPLADHLDAEALHRSTHGQQRLHDACVVPNLAEALEGVVCAMGTSRRSGPVHQPDELTPRDLHQLIPQHINNGEVALLFGTEDKGLSREELLACDYLIQIPAQPDYPTLNLSHAAAICLYESFLAVAGSRIDESSKDRKGEPADLAFFPSGPFFRGPSLAVPRPKSLLGWRSRSMNLLPIVRIIHSEPPRRKGRQEILIVLKKYQRNIFLRVMRVQYLNSAAHGTRSPLGRG
ncbi:MAG: RNA methyltransferase [Planctomycetota bacterium]